MKVLEFIRVLKQRGRTVILSASSLAHTKDICDRLAVLRRGQIEIIGTLHDFLQRRDALYYVSDLLPQATAERAVKLIRQDLDIRDDLSEKAVETQNAIASETGYKALPALERVLQPLVERVEPGPNLKVQADPTVNHELLAALTRNPSTALPTDSEVGEKGLAKPDP